MILVSKLGFWLKAGVAWIWASKWNLVLDYWSLVFKAVGFGPISIEMGDMVQI